VARAVVVDVKAEEVNDFDFYTEFLQCFPVKPDFRQLTVFQKPANYIVLSLIGRVGALRQEDFAPVKYEDAYARLRVLVEDEPARCANRIFTSEHEFVATFGTEMVWECIYVWTFLKKLERIFDNLRRSRLVGLQPPRRFYFQRATK